MFLRTGIGRYFSMIIPIAISSPRSIVERSDGQGHVWLVGRRLHCIRSCVHSWREAYQIRCIYCDILARRNQNMLRCGLCWKTAESVVSLEPGSMDARIKCQVHMSVTQTKLIASTPTRNQATSQIFLYPLIQPHQLTPFFLKIRLHSTCVASSRYTMQLQCDNQTHPKLNWPMTIQHDEVTWQCVDGPRNPQASSHMSKHRI